HRHVGLAAAERGDELRGLQEALETRRRQTQHNFAESDDRFLHDELFVYHEWQMTTRRMFLGTAATALTAKAYATIPGANERLRIGVIGCGGQAMGHMKTLVGMKQADNVEVVAVCDVFDKRAQEAAQLTGGKAIRNYHDLLASKDVDYVLIAT